MEDFVIRAPKGASRKKRRVGRGPASGKGSTAGRGTKGQKSRSGGGVRLGFEGGQMPLYRRVARRGFSNYPFKKEYVIINVERLNKFNDGDTISIESLIEKKLLKKATNFVKILGNGELNKKLTIKGIKISKNARNKIEKAGGKIIDNNEAKAEEETAVPKKTSAAKKEKADTVDSTVTKKESEKPDSGKKVE